MLTLEREPRTTLTSASTRRQALAVSLAQAGYKQWQIAAEMNITPSAVSQLLARADAREKARIRIVEQYLAEKLG